MAELLAHGRQSGDQSRTGQHRRWETAVVAPCPVYEKREYSYRVNTFETFQVLRAHSSGYEKPHYSWYLENVLQFGCKPVALDVQCRDVNGHEISPPAVHRVLCTFKIDGGKLELYTVGAFADITLALRVVVSESSPGVMKNYYPDRSLFINVRAENLTVEWNSEYRDAFEACWKKFLKIKLENRVVPRDPMRDPRPPWGVRRSEYATSSATSLAIPSATPPTLG